MGTASTVAGTEYRTLGFLSARGQAVLARVAKSLVKVPERIIQVGGHTEAVEISGKLRKKFPTNWELSTVRATHVV